ncbi:hypothetical protein [Tautonia marina]|uniref:hypothetical protein n=1 Tax=Tautonia marina TaxID=2653855 RepID=UPI00126130BD|nr:hypothetical protein [Tautonia marina]
MAKTKNPWQARGSDATQSNLYAAPVETPTSSTPATDLAVGEPRNVTIRFGHLSGAFKVASRQQRTWILILLVLVVLGAVANLILAFGLGGLSGAIGIPAGAVDASAASFNAADLLIQGVTFLSATVVSAFFLGGLFRTACKQVRGKPIAVGDLFGAIDVFGQVFLVTLLIEVLTSIAVSVVVIPFGIAFAMLPPRDAPLALLGALVFGMIAFALVTSRLMLAIPLVVDGRQTAVAAIRKSWVALRGQTLAAIVFNVLAAILSGLGAILLGVGLLLTFPIYYVAIALVYRDLFLGKFGETA